jgi:peroxiredoxin
MTSSPSLAARLAALALVLAATAGCRSDEVLRRGSGDLARAREEAALRLAVHGERIPDFELDTLSGTRVRLSDYLGRILVLEWLNPSCPFTRAAHEAGTLRDYPAEAREAGVVWLGVASSAPRKHGGDREDLAAAVEAWGVDFPVLLDEGGELGRCFDATHTPEVFLIDERGVLRYAGAVDNQPFNKVRGGGEVLNHLAAALAQLREGRPVEPAMRQAYGSRVKYARPALAD